ncbi:ABC transporter ATP-binding protein [Bacillus smithii]|uniref:ABC transporter ATP-binding protein n=1 Tax=Bacillus smithii TaxID=1479 RepID=UPI003D1FFC71
MEYVIEVKHLRKAFVHKTALKDVSFSIRKGETFGFLGPSGAGKTTTIKILTAQLKTFEGEVKVFGRPVQQLKGSYQMKRIGILTDNSGLYERLSVYDNLSLYCHLYQVSKSRIDEVLDEVRLLEAKKMPVKKLSKGMKQRITLARAMLHKPELLFLDEPTSSLDPVSSKRIHEILRRLNQEGTTIFLTTHDMYEAEKICDRVAFLHQGEIKLLDSPQNLRLRFANSSISLILTGNRKVIVDKNQEGAKKITEFILKGELLSIHSNEPTLGDIFEKVTGKELLS